MTFNESKELAIKEAIELNRIAGFKKWNCISMNHLGDWFADECHDYEMKKGESIFMAPNGMDITLTVKFTDTPICDWDKSLTKIPD